MQREQHRESLLRLHRQVLDNVTQSRLLRYCPQLTEDQARRLCQEIQGADHEIEVATPAILLDDAAWSLTLAPATGLSASRLTPQRPPIIQSGEPDPPRYLESAVKFSLEHWPKDLVQLTSGRIYQFNFYRDFPRESRRRRVMTIVAATSLEPHRCSSSDRDQLSPELAQQIDNSLVFMSQDEVEQAEILNGQKPLVQELFVDSEGVLYRDSTWHERGHAAPASAQMVLPLSVGEFANQHHMRLDLRLVRKNLEGQGQVAT